MTDVNGGFTVEIRNCSGNFDVFVYGFTTIVENVRKLCEVSLTFRDQEDNIYLLMKQEVGNYR